MVEAVSGMNASTTARGSSPFPSAPALRTDHDNTYHGVPPARDMNAMLPRIYKSLWRDPPELAADEAEGVKDRKARRRRSKRTGNKGPVWIPITLGILIVVLWGVAYYIRRSGGGDGGGDDGGTSAGGGSGGVYGQIEARAELGDNDDGPDRPLAASSMIDPVERTSPGYINAFGFTACIPVTPALVSGLAFMCMPLASMIH